ncbi:MAG TPA: hypothetical protein VFH09_01850 [Nitrososphaera sp.]|nr:hypothetical protein [Nitrososphaera sp.]
MVGRREIWPEHVAVAIYVKGFGYSAVGQQALHGFATGICISYGKHYRHTF